jgi:hypothetical protein
MEVTFMKYYIVPEQDIKNLERARQKLWDRFGNDFTVPVNEFTGPMYEIVFRRYPRAYFVWLINVFISLGLWGKRYSD